MNGRKRTRKMYPTEKKRGLGQKEEEKLGIKVSKTKPDWLTLPDLAMVRILEHLDKTSRSNFALTCKRLEELSHSPSLWRVANLDFVNRKHAVSDYRVVCNHAKYLHHLQVFGMRSTTRPRTLEDQEETVTMRFLPNFLRKYITQARLKSIFLSDVNVDKNFHKPVSFVKSLKAVLSTQCNLVVVQLSSLRVQYHHGIALLGALATTNGSTLSSLNIFNFFVSNVSTLGSEFNSIIEKFSKLKEFFVNYNCLDDGAISALAESETSSKTLQLLSVDVYGCEPHDHVISTSTWRQFKAACPRTKVTFDLDEIERYHDFISILTPGMPLHTLKLWTGYDIEDEARLPALFVHLAENFNDVIESATFQVDNSATPIDAELLFFVQQCKRLSGIELFAILGVDVIERICRLQQTKKIHLEKFHVTLNSATAAEAVDLMLVEDAYADMLYDPDDCLDFEFSTDADGAIFSDSDVTIDDE
ncbi:F-box only protein 39-like [Lineus longissimus]|uniref:F-box only protein 39-like n=1 Tax=Lineus longissimus TaxID=88925 RepID=UPI00315D83B8